MDRFDRRVVVLPPGRTRAYDPGEWRDALVVVESYRLCAPKSLARAIT